MHYQGGRARVRKHSPAEHPLSARPLCNPSRPYADKPHSTLPSARLASPRTISVDELYNRPGSDSDLTLAGKHDVGCRIRIEYSNSVNLIGE